MPSLSSVICIYSWVLIVCPLAYPYEKHAVVGHLQHPVVRPGLGICEHSLPPPLEKSSGNLGRGEAVEQLDGRVKTRYLERRTRRRL